MAFQGFQAKYRRLFQESATWKLLRADNAPVILAFLADLFSEDSEIPCITLDNDLFPVVERLANDDLLEMSYRDHSLSGNWKDHHDCHLKADLTKT